VEPAKSYTLFGVEGSYYGAKTRCYLLRKGIPFREIQADRKVFKEIILPRVGYPVVPVLLTPEDETLQDTASIVDALEARHPSFQPPPAVGLLPI
jgi:glutathione S-transferase